MLVAVQVRPSFAIVTLMASYLAFGLAEEVTRQFRRLMAPEGAELDDEEEDEEPLDEVPLLEEEELLD